MMHQQSALPGNLAIRLCLSQSQPLCHLLGVSSLKPICPHTQLREPQDASASLHLGQCSSSSSSSPERSASRSCVRRDSDSHKKKRVVFADFRGLSLTAVRLFFPEAPSPADDAMSAEPVSPTGTPFTEPPPSVRPQAQGPSSGPRYRLRLAFPQPSADLNTFYSRLREAHVQLQSCSVTERSLRGTVRICGFGFDKAVHVRVSFDSWKSHADVPCSRLLQPRYGASDSDELFSFDVALPQSLDPKECVEFCVSYRPGSGAPPLWDNNKGQNYRVCVEHEAGSGGGPEAPVFLHRTLTCARQRPPSWPRCGNPGLRNPYTPGMFSYQRSWDRLENPAPFC